MQLPPEDTIRPEANTRICAHCAYSLIGLPETCQCPECGEGNAGPQLAIKGKQTISVFGDNLIYFALFTALIFSDALLPPSLAGLPLILICLLVFIRPFWKWVPWLGSSSTTWIFVADDLVVLSQPNDSSPLRRRVYKLSPRSHVSGMSLFGMGYIRVYISFWTVLWLDVSRKQSLDLVNAIERFRRNNR